MKDFLWGLGDACCEFFSLLPGALVIGALCAVVGAIIMALFSLIPSA